MDNDLTKSGQPALAEWLRKEMERKNLNHRELGRQAGIYHSSVGRALDPQGRVSFEVCIKLAYALKANPVSVLELAGLLPRTHPNQAAERDLVFLFQQLNAEQKDQVLTYARFLLDAKRPG